MSTPSSAFGSSPDERPSVARMYDYFLGGHHNFPVDRAAAEQIIALHPETPLVAQANRAFLRRAVTFLAEQGIRQFLDLGSGIPTVGNVHEVAQAAAADARVIYVDIDPVAVTHSASLLENDANATVIQADARRPETIVGHPEVRRLLDFSRPVGVLLVSFLHFVTDDAEAERLVQGLREVLAPGSYIAISHAATEVVTPVMRQAIEVYRGSSSPSTIRTPAQIARFFAGLDLVEPGLVATPLWRPEGPGDVFLDTPERAMALVGVGRVP